MIPERSETRAEATSSAGMAGRLGVCQWFHYEAYEDVRLAVRLLRELGVRRVRTGISWADYHRSRGEAWYDWQMEQLAEFDLLVSIWHVPPSIAEGAASHSPPSRLEDYADFVAQMIERYPKIEALELWNEPNNWLKWNFKDFDPAWEKFATMIRLAAAAARARRMPTVLGGIIPVDPQWLGLMDGYGALEDIDVVAIHGFPEMWWPDHRNWDWHDHWRGWEDKVERIRACARGRPVWITETGLATWDVHARRRARHDLQATMLRRAAAASAERVYWYSLVDLAAERAAIEGFHVDENEYHLGLVQEDGVTKPAFDVFRGLLGGSDTPPGVSGSGEKTGTRATFGL